MPDYKHRCVYCNVGPEHIDMEFHQCWQCYDVICFACQRDRKDFILDEDDEEWTCPDCIKPIPQIHLPQPQHYIVDLTLENDTPKKWNPADVIDLTLDSDSDTTQPFEVITTYKKKRPLRDAVPEDDTPVNSDCESDQDYHPNKKVVVTNEYPFTRAAAVNDQIVEVIDEILAELYFEL
jgi:hypothetical protein